MSRHLRPLLLLLLLLIPAVAAGVAYPEPAGFVNDFAQVLQPGSRSRLESMLSAFERASGVEVAVVTLPSLGGEPVENAATALFAQWGIGKKGKDDGVLFLIAPSDRRMRIEVGYGLEGVLNDALAGRILDTAVVPHFKAGELDAGITAGAAAIVSRIASKEGIAFDAGAAYGAELPQAPPEKRGGPFSTVFKILFVILMIYLFIRHPWLFLLLLSSGGRGGSGFGGGFGGFGGGLSGGGGASRGW